MPHNPLEITPATPKPLTRRVWYGRGSSRLITDDAQPALPPADVIDAAIAGFERIDSAATPTSNQNASQVRSLISPSFAADLSAQLAKLDRQRDRLARLLREVSA
jgi:hypothetical protein